MDSMNLKCPQCGASLEIKDEVDIFYCMYCGTKIVVKDRSKFAIASKTVNNILQHRERMKQMKIEEEKQNDKAALIGLLIMFGFGLLLMFLGSFGGKLGW